MKKNILKYFLEMLIVAFGVFLGIYVSEWKSQNKLKKDAEKSLSYIIEELKINESVLTDIVQYHEMIKLGFDSLDLYNLLSEEQSMASYFSNDIFKFHKIKGWTGVRLPHFEDIAYESSKISGSLQEFDIEDIQRISRTYKYQTHTQSFGKMTLEKLVNMNSETTVIDVVGIMELLTNDVLTTEKSLLSVLKNTIKQLNEEK